MALCAGCVIKLGAHVVMRILLHSLDVMAVVSGMCAGTCMHACIVRCNRRGRGGTATASKTCRLRGPVTNMHAMVACLVCLNCGTTAVQNIAVSHNPTLFPFRLCSTLQALGGHRMPPYLGMCGALIRGGFHASVSIGSDGDVR